MCFIFKILEMCFILVSSNSSIQYFTFYFHKNPSVYRQCTEDEFDCGTSWGCIAKDKVCDLVDDCGNHADEDMCGKLHAYIYLSAYLLWVTVRYPEGSLFRRFVNPKMK